MSSRSKVSFKPQLIRQEGNRNLLKLKSKTKSRSKPRSKSRSPKSEYARSAIKSRAVRVSYSRAGSVRRVGYSAVRSRVNYANPIRKAGSIKASKRTLYIIDE